MDDAHWEDSLQELLPQPQQAYQGCFHWLLTSREQQPWKKYFGETFKPCVLGLLTKEQAQLYLDTSLKPEVKQQADYAENCQWLIQQMAGLPLALAQAAAYINQSLGHKTLLAHNALTEYCRLFETQGEDLALAGSGIEANDEHTVLSTWLITLSALLSEETLAQGQGALAIYLLLNCAYCDGASIPVKLLAAFHSHQDASHRPNEVQIENAVRCLVNYSLATRLDDGSIQVHQLVQQVLRWWMGKQLTPQSQALTKKQGSQVSELEFRLQQAHIDQEQVLVVLVGNLINYARELAKKPEIKPQVALVPHLTRLIGYWQAVNKKLPDKRNQRKMSRLYSCLGNIQSIQGSASASKASYQHALDFFEQCRPKDHPYVAITLTNLGNAYGDLGDVLKQKALLEGALVILESHYGKDHYQVAITLASLGNAYGALGDVSKKKAFLERALLIQESHHGKNHYEVAKTLTNLGNAYGDLGDALKKKELLEPALVIDEAYYGKDHYEVAITLTNLAFSELSLGHPQIALTKAQLLGDNYLCRLATINIAG